MSLYIGVIEWGSDYAMSPTVVVADNEDKARAEGVRDIVAFFKGCDLEDPLRTLADNPPNYADPDDVRRWYMDQWDITTDAMLTVYKHRAGSHIADEV